MKVFDEKALNKVFQAGEIKPFSTAKGWTKKRITFNPPFENAPTISLTLGEGKGSDNTGKNSIKYIGYESLTNKTCTVAINDSATTQDVVVAWMARAKTQ